MPQDDKTSPDYAQGWDEALAVMAKAVVAAQDNDHDTLRRQLDAAVEGYEAAGGDSYELDAASPWLQAAYDRIPAAGGPNPTENHDPSPDVEVAADEDAAQFQPSPGARHERDIPPAIWPKNTPTRDLGPGRP